MELTPNQQLWIAALRSGKYEQGKHFLHKENGSFCCLGVAAELFKTPTTAIRRNQLNCIVYDGRDTEAPDYVVKALGLRNPPGGFALPLIGSTALAQLNDDGLTFNQIADILEAMPEDCFVS